MAKRLSVVISQGQSHNPTKRKLEEDLVARLIMEAGVDVTVVPNLYDLAPDGTGMLALQGITGPMVVVSWLYSRAAHWVLDRHGVDGEAGKILLRGDDEDADEAEDPDEASGEHPDAAEGNGAAADGDAKPRVIHERPRSKRQVYCLDFKASANVEDFVAEIRRIASEQNQQVVNLLGWIGGSPSPEQWNRYEHPTNDTALGGPGRAASAPANAALPQASPDTQQNSSSEEVALTDAQPLRVAEEAGRRWYPVIDFSRCTNCMECIDFCLFGVYGVDASETILVEQPDNCRKGCPACSRVCPENAIMFPQHKSPGIAGAPAEAASLKIDLSRLFGAPDAVEVAARERDEQLLLAGREAVGLSVGVPKRQPEKAPQPKDELDNLLDELDALDL